MRAAARAGTTPQGTSPGSARRSELATLLERAVAEQIITAEQATAVRALQAEPASAIRRSRVPVYAEVFGYLGAVLVTVGAVSLDAQFWDDLAVAVRLLILGGAAVVLWGVGALVDDRADPALWRLRSAMWLLSTAAAAGFAGILAADGFDWDGEPVALTAGAAAAVMSAGLWRLQDRPAQHLTTLAGAAVAVGAGAAWASGSFLMGTGLWLLGALWVLGGLGGNLPPRYAALPAGAGLALLGAGVTSQQWEGLGPVFGLITAVALLGVGAGRGQLWLTVAGIVGLLIYVPWTSTYYFADTMGVPLTLLLSGLVLLAGALSTFRHRAALMLAAGGDDPD